jgi:urea transport system substrate-binding protein
MMNFLSNSYKKALMASAFLFILLMVLIYQWNYKKSSEPIRIGVLHSFTGTMAVSEKPLVDAIQLAVEEINEHGGLLGRRILMITADGKSDAEVFASEAQRLIEEEKVSVLFACWTSRCRKAVKPIVEQHHHLMFYPLQYEGLEQSPNIIYTGSVPNQQIIPGTRWALDQFGKKVYLIGSDYIFPHIANFIIRDLVRANQGGILGEQYVSLGGSKFDQIIADIKKKKPNMILNTLNGDSNAAFFSAMKKANLMDLPILSFSVSENEMKAWGGTQLKQHYAVWSYFQSFNSENNKNFVTAFQNRFGFNRNTSDPMVASYVGVRLWAQAVAIEKSVDPQRVNSATLLRQSYAGPSGVSTVDSQTRHMWKMFRVGKVRSDGQFDLILSSKGPLRPAPWPMYRSREEWQAISNRRTLGFKL